MQSLPESRSSLRLTAMLATVSTLLATVPSGAHAEDEKLSLVMPRGGEMTGVPQGAGSDGLAPAADPFETLPDAAASAVPAIEVRLERADTHEVLTMRVPIDGRLAADDAKSVAYFFRCRRTGKQRPMSAGVLALLADVAAQWSERTIEIVSGFRAPPHGVPHSKHFKGQAIDLRIPGIRTKTLRDYVWRQNRGVGVGYYAKENFVHMDSRPDAQDRAWSGSEEGGPELLNPRWARKARRMPPTPRVVPEPAPQPYALAPWSGGGPL